MHLHTEAGTWDTLCEWRVTADCTVISQEGLLYVFFTVSAAIVMSSLPRQGLLPSFSGFLLPVNSQHGHSAESSCMQHCHKSRLTSSIICTGSTAQVNMVFAQPGSHPIKFAGVKTKPPVSGTAPSQADRQTDILSTCSEWHMCDHVLCTTYIVTMCARHVCQHSQMRAGPLFCQAGLVLNIAVVKMDSTVSIPVTEIPQKIPHQIPARPKLALKVRR